jgi:hypothetical protein
MLTTTRRKLVPLLPWTALTWYGVDMLFSYSTTLDKTLTYRKPAVAVAPEDVLGLGFWPAWAIVAVLVLALSTLAYALGARKIWMMAAVAAVFAALSLVDYYLFCVLASQVLALT